MSEDKITNTPETPEEKQKAKKSDRIILTLIGIGFVIMCCLGLGMMSVIGIGQNLASEAETSTAEVLDSTETINNTNETIADIEERSGEIVQLPPTPEETEYPTTIPTTAPTDTPSPSPTETDMPSPTATKIPPSPTSPPTIPKFEEDQNVFIADEGGGAATTATVYDGYLGFFGPHIHEADCSNISKVKESTETNDIFNPYGATKIRRVLVCKSDVYYLIYMAINETTYPYEEWDGYDSIAYWGGWVEEDYLTTSLDPVGLNYYLPPGEMNARGGRGAYLSRNYIFGMDDSAHTVFPGGETIVTLESAEIDEVHPGVNCQNCWVDLVIVLHVSEWAETANKAIFDLQSVNTSGDTRTFLQGGNIENITIDGDKLIIQALVSQWTETVYLSINGKMENISSGQDSLRVNLEESSVFFYFTPD